MAPEYYAFRALFLWFSVSNFDISFRLPLPSTLMIKLFYNPEKLEDSRGTEVTTLTLRNHSKLIDF